jgi:hypothetical protein
MNQIIRMMLSERAIDRPSPKELLVSGFKARIWSFPWSKALCVPLLLSQTGEQNS